MSNTEDSLYIKKSTLPGAGKGLFTKKFIPKGAKIIEYTGTITTWADANHDDGNNPYIFFISSRHVIDALMYPEAKARYANDAKGLSKIKGISNNAEYEQVGKKVYISAVKDIPAGAEILVTYGKDYWKVIRENKASED